MKNSKSIVQIGVPKTIVRALNAAFAGALWTFAGAAGAIEIKTESGWNGALNTKVGVSAMWRTEEPERALIGRGGVASAAPVIAMNGGTAADYTNDGMNFAVGNLNYGKGDMTSSTLRFLTELQLDKGDTSLMVRVKGWYDNTLKDSNTPWGNRAAWPNGVGPTVMTGGRWDKPLSDDGAPALSRFDGLYLLDAFVAQNFDIVGQPAQVRVGRQATNWGEGLFVRGISQMSPIDVAALRRPGTELKEALLPTASVVANVGLPGGMSLEGIYQLKWEPSALEYCGTFWNGSHATLDPVPGKCNVLDYMAGPNATTLSTGSLSVLQAEGEQPKKSGAWGLMFRFPVETIDTEFGLYALNIASTTPTLAGTGIKIGGTVAPRLEAVSAAGKVTANLKLDYVDDIQIYGISAATNFFGASFGAELSRQVGVPVNYHAADVNAFLGVNTPVRPMSVAQLIGVADGTPVSFKGYERHDKTQLIVNAVATLGGVAGLFGATNGILIGEVGAESNDLPDYRKAGALRFAPRFGRYATFTDAAGIVRIPSTCGGATGAGTATVVVGPIMAPTGVNTYACANDGFATSSSWGYKLRLGLTYPQIFGTSWSAAPSLFFAHDVDGVSMDGQFQEGRKTLAFGLEFDLNREHTINLGYTTFSGKWNGLRDHDNVTFAYTYSF